MLSVLDKVKSFLGGNKTDRSTFGVINIYAPFSGIVVNQANIPDEGFSEGFMGTGIGLKPLADGQVLVPISGNLEVLFKTKHAYVVREPVSKIAVFLHLGIDTVNIPEDKRAFETSLEQGQNVQEKSVLCNMNLEVIRREAKSDISALMVYNENLDNKFVQRHKKDGESVEKGELIMSVVNK